MTDVTVHETAGGDFWDFVRRSTIGRGAFVETPFGRRRITYADHTASGRGVSFIEDYLRDSLALYGNTHTEDDATGSITSQRLAAAEASLKRMVHAGPAYKLIADGAGFSLEGALASKTGGETDEPADEGGLYSAYVAQAESLAQELELRFAGRKLKSTEADLIPFVYV